VVERRNQTVVVMARYMLKTKGLPAYFWGEAVPTVVYILNRAPTHTLDGKTPYEAWYGERPVVHYFRTFGCIAPTSSTRARTRTSSTTAAPRPSSSAMNRAARPTAATTRS
jgi:hypothetical protein